MFLSYGLEKPSQQRWSMGTSKRNVAHPLQFLPITSFCWELHFMFLPGFQKPGSRIFKKQLLSEFYLFIEFKHHRTGFIGSKFRAAGATSEMEEPFSDKKSETSQSCWVFSDHFLAFLLSFDKFCVNPGIILSELRIIYLIWLGELWGSSQLSEFWRGVWDCFLLFCCEMWLHPSPSISQRLP